LVGGVSSVVLDSGSTETESILAELRPSGQTFTAKLKKGFEKKVTKAYSALQKYR